MQTTKVLAKIHFSLIFLFSFHTLAFEFTSGELKISGNQVTIPQDTNWKFSKKKNLEKYESKETKDEFGLHRDHILIHKTASGEIDSLVIRRSSQRKGFKSSETTLYSNDGMALCKGSHIKNKNSCLAMTPNQCRNIIEIFDSTEKIILKRVSVTDVHGNTEIRHEKESSEARDLRLQKFMNLKEESSPQLSKLVATVQSDFPDLRKAQKLTQKTGPDSFLEWLLGSAPEDCRRYLAINPSAGTKMDGTLSPAKANATGSHGSK